VCVWVSKACRVCGFTKACVCGGVKGLCVGV
jgi:hypothetical protein